MESRTLLRRLTLVLRDGRVNDVPYPVFPPDRAAADVLDVLRKRSRERTRAGPRGVGPDDSGALYRATAAARDFAAAVVLPALPAYPL